MSEDRLTETQAARAFADQINDIDQRSKTHGPADPEHIRQLLLKHRTALMALEKREAEAARTEHDRHSISS